MTPEEKLKDLGYPLPPAPAPVGSYIPAIRIDNLVMTSGQIPIREGKLVSTGKIGGNLSIEQGAEAARVAVVNALSQLAVAAGGLSNVKRIVRLGVFVNSADGFTQQPKVANGASDLLVAVFGDAGRHVRAAVGSNELPLDAPVEIELTAELKQ
ncbi:MAG: RidA family protein [Planctomycetes bacterium]|nr:RidA family protein [Planctomycetota bacterium]